MAYQECPNGHIYDTDQFPECPYCRGGGNRINFDNGAFSGGIGKTVAANGMQPMNFGGGSDAIGATVAPAAYRQKKEEQAEPRTDVGKTVAAFKKKMNIEPAAGWLVCFEGPEKGNDYRVYAKINRIGRGEKMDICIKNDNMISRENHARLAYDEKHNCFHLIPGDGENTVYINEEPVYVPTKLASHDIIEIGECKLLFVPLCDDRFTWETGPRKEE